MSLFSLFQNTIAGNIVNLNNPSLDKVFLLINISFNIWLQSAKEKLNNLTVHSLVNLEKTAFVIKGESISKLRSRQNIPIAKLLSILLHIVIDLFR